jgi:hypothetical protein
MAERQFGLPVLIALDGSVSILKQIPLAPFDGAANYDEKWLQRLIFDNPECLPISDLDATYTRLVPVCVELNTPAGPIDALFITPEGRLVVLEVKLWRNPEARRKVIAQILDYAKELSRWSYEDLQREVSRATKRSGNALFQIAAKSSPGLDEASFVDEVSRGLERGRFMLLIVGDGIREGVGAITAFLEEFATLDFSFGLVELAIYSMPDGKRLVQPRILAKSLTIRRSVISLQSGLVSISADTRPDAEAEPPTDAQRFYQSFWTEFLLDLRLDDQSQPLPNATARGNIFFSMPPSGGTAWITVFFSQASGYVGVFLTFTKGAFADTAYNTLHADQKEIDTELGIAVAWESVEGKYSIIARKSFPELRGVAYREDIKTFLADRVNRFVNVFRPRLARIAQEA